MDEAQISSQSIGGSMSAAYNVGGERKFLSGYNLNNRLLYTNAYMNGKIIVAGMGNFKQAVDPFVVPQFLVPVPNEKIFPAGYDGVLAVGATGHDNMITGFSQTGTHIDLVAPGVDVLAPVSEYLEAAIEKTAVREPLFLFRQQDYENYGYFGGTSAATPIVAGAASLIWGYARQQNKELFNDDVENILRLSADNTIGTLPTNHSTVNPLGIPWNSEYGYGRVNVYRAMQYVQQGTLIHSTHAVGSTNTTVNPGYTQTIQPNRAALLSQNLIMAVFTPNKLPLQTLATRYNLIPYEIRQEIDIASLTPQWSQAKVWGVGSEMKTFNDQSVEEWRTGYAPLDTATNAVDRGMLNSGSVLPGLEYFHSGLGWCEPVIGSLRNGKITLRTFVYRVLNFTNGQELGANTREGWLPCKPEDVVFHYTVFVPSANLAMRTNTTQDELEQLIINSRASIEKYHDTQFFLYPQPAQEEVHLTFKIASEQSIHIEVIDVFGRKVASLPEQLYKEGLHNITLSLQGLSNGVYGVRLKGKQGNSEISLKQQAVIVQR